MNNSECALKIKQSIIILIVLVILGTNIQLFGFSKLQVANNNKEEEAQEVQIAQVEQTDNIQRETEVTTRSSEERTVVEKQYITIDEITILKDMDLTKRCGISKEDFKILMKNLKVDKLGFFYENCDTIYDLCEKYEINEIFFCGLIAAESGWKISSNHRNTCNYISMMSKGKLIRYSTPEEGLEAATKLLHNRYLTQGGSCYYGKTISSVQKRFCPNSSTWVGLVYGCMKQIIK